MLRNVVVTAVSESRPPVVYTPHFLQIEIHPHREKQFLTFLSADKGKIQVREAQRETGEYLLRVAVSGQEDHWVKRLADQSFTKTVSRIPIA